MIRIVVPTLAAIGIALGVPAASAAQPAAGAQPWNVTLVSGVLRRSDTLFSPRRLTESIANTWLPMAHAFNANRLVWVYTDGTQFLPRASTAGMPTQCTFPYWVPKGDPSARAMACRAAAGKTLGILPDIRTRAWRNHQLRYVKRQIDNGCTSFQQDSPLAPMSYGCATQRQTAAYYQWLQSAAQDYAKSKNPKAHLTFSMNLSSNQNWAGNTWLFRNFDFLIGEVYADRSDIVAKLQQVASRAASEFSNVSAVTIANDDVWLNQRGIASAYALGLTVIAPWDVYIGDGTQRFFGKPADFASLFGLVRAQPALFDDYVSQSNSYKLAIPAQGYVTKADGPARPDWETISWSCQSGFQTIREGTTVYVGNRKFVTPVSSGAGNLHLPKGSRISAGDPVQIGAPEQLVSIRKNIHAPRKKAVHVVNWSPVPTALYLLLKREDFPIPPTQIVTPAKPAPRPISYQAIGDYFVYSLEAVDIWAVLF